MIKLFIVSFLLVVSSFGYAFEAGRKYPITFFHVSDTHGQFYKSTTTNSGGFAILATMVQQARQEAAATDSLFFLTSGGDVNTGTPESDLLMAEPDFTAMNLLNFDAMAVGNHEFDRHWKYMLVQQGWAQFPFLAANIRPEIRQAFPIIPYVIKNVQGLKVAFLGLATEHTPMQSLPTNSVGLIFDPAIETAKRWVPFLNKHADVVVVLSHLGWCSLGDCISPNDVHLAQQVPGIDLILGGHSHTAMETPDVQNGTYIFHAFEKNQKVGILKAEFLDDRLTIKSSQLAPIVGDEDPTVAAALAPLMAASSEKLKVVVAQTAVYLDGERSNVRYKETNLGNLITKAIKLRTQSDIAISNAGGIRASIAVGPVTYGDIFKVLPFGNTVCTVELTGAELIQYMAQIATMAPGDGNFPQMSGVSLKTDVANNILELKVNNRPVSAQGRYKIAMNNFMAEGGDFYPRVKDKSSFIDTGLTMEYIFRSYIEQKKVVQPDDIAVTGYYQRGVNP